MGIGKHGVNFIDAPLTKEQIQYQQASGNSLCANIAVDMDDIMGGIEVLNDIASEAVTGTCLLQDIGYELVDVADGNRVVLAITGWVDENDL